MRCSILLLLALFQLNASAQRILHFTKTSGFDHNTRAVSFAMFQSIADEIGATVDDDATGAPFISLDDLLQYDVVVFSNTSGADLLDAQQRTNFEQYIAGGGHVLGIHAASDTYRHSTANGNNTDVWDYYAELIGASVQENPNHVDGTPSYSMQHIGTHASTANLPDPWVKNEEYYYWEGGYFGPDNSVVLEVEGTVGPNGQVNSYDAARPMSWYRQLSNGSKVFYTALGHAQSNFSDGELFRTHIKDALVWMLDGTTGMQERGENAVSIFPNPANGTLTIHADPKAVRPLLDVTDPSGRILHQQRVAAFPFVLDVHAFPAGSYMITINGLPLSRVTIIH